VAQTEAATGSGPLARYWLHNGFITVNQEKMSKSLGNFFLVREVLQQFPPQVVRFYLLSTHYRSPLDFDDGKLEMNQRSLERLITTIDLLDELLRMPITGQAGEQPVETALSGQTAFGRKAFQEAMDDDFNTALAIARLFDLAREINTAVNEAFRRLAAGESLALAPFREARMVFGELLEVLGLDPDYIRGRRQTGSDSHDQLLVGKLLELLISLRQGARERKDWATADYIRDQLKQLEITLEDAPAGTRWKRG